MVLNVEAGATLIEATAMLEQGGGRSPVRLYIPVKDLGYIPYDSVCLETF